MRVLLVVQEFIYRGALASALALAHARWVV
jgi:hypothetical protein